MASDMRRDSNDGIPRTREKSRRLTRRGDGSASAPPYRPTVRRVRGGKGVSSLRQQYTALAVVGAAVTSALTIVCFRLVQADLSAAVLLVVPAVLWAAAVCGYTRTRNRHEHLEFLYESLREVQGADGFRGAAEQLLQQLSQLLQAEFAELLFVGSRSQDGDVQLVTLRGSELTSRTRRIRAEERL